MANVGKFTPKWLDSLKPPGTADKMIGEYREKAAGREGFGVRVTKKGTKTFFFAYKFDGERKRMSLGTYPSTSLEKAHEDHDAAKKKLANGIDPGAAKREEKIRRQQEPTISELCDDFMKWCARNRKRQDEYRRCLDKDVVPAWGKRKSIDITRRDVNVLLQGIVDRGAPIQSNNVFELIRRMFNWAVEEGVLEHSPCVGVKPKAKRTPKDRHLTQEEIKIFLAQVETSWMSHEIRRALKLILVTGQRPGEVIGMHRREINGHWWNLPGERTKNGKPHRVYLTKTALELIGKKDGFIFPSPIPDEINGKEVERPIDTNALAHALRRNFEIPERDEQGLKIIGENGKILTRNHFQISHFTPHDLRRTAATHISRIGFPLVVEKILNHTPRTVTGTVYDQYDYDQEKQRALEAWAREINRIVEGGVSNQVIQIRAEGQ